MESITISKKKYLELTRLDIPKEVRNTEARMFHYDHRGKHKVFKDYYLSDGVLFGSKLFTVQALDHYKEYLPESFVIPDSSVTINGKVVGFTVPFVEGIPLETILKDTHVSLKEQIYYLKKIGELLEQLKEIREYTPLKDIYINDLQESNFIINPNNRSIKTIDLDSCKISTNSPFPSRYMSNKDLLSRNTYEKYTINKTPAVNEGDYIANQESDMYCYMIVILNFLMGSNISRMNEQQFYHYLNYLEGIGVSKELLNCFETILRYDPNLNPVHYLDGLNYTQTGRAKEQVYTLHKKRTS